LPYQNFEYRFQIEMKSIAKRRISLRKLLMDCYAALLARFGPRNWWPADSPFEVCVGAILTQNTAWKNVAKAINNLKQASALDPLVVHDMPIEKLAHLIRPAGYYNVKAVRLRNFISLIVEKHRGDLSSLFSVPLESLREELLSINGIGKETADSIILYAAGKPIFVVDAYTKRVLERHKIIAEKADYDSIQRLFHAHLPRDVALFNDFHAQIVAVGHNYCKRQPVCEICPLRGFFLPGPVFGPS
jgi:endonuclease-3 related protein